MSIHCSWYDKDKRVIVAVYDHGWTWNDYMQAKYDADEMLNSVGYQVHFLADIRGASFLPSDSALSYFTSAFSTAPSNLGKVVTVGASRVVRMLFHAVQKLTLNQAARNLCYIDTIEEAHELLEEITKQKLVVIQTTNVS